MDEEKLMNMLIKQFNQIESQITTLRNDVMTKKQFNQIESQITTLRNDVMTKMDAVYKEVLDTRQEQAMHTGAHQRVDKTLEEYDNRIKKLELPSSVAHTIKK